MAIDTTPLTQLINEFRNISAKDSISPESVGYLMQRIADKDTATLEQIIENTNSLVELVGELQKGVGNALEIARDAASKADTSATASSEAAEKALDALRLANDAIRSANSALEAASKAVEDSLETARLAQESAAVSVLARDGATARFSAIIPDVVQAELQGSTSPIGEVVYMSARKIFAYKVGNAFFLAWNNPAYPETMYNEDMSHIRKDKVFVCGEKAYVWSDRENDLVEIAGGKADRAMFVTLSVDQFDTLPTKDADTYYFIHE